MFLGTLKVIGIILEALLLFYLLTVVHELGRFFAAKWRGLKVEKFAVWFGKPPWSKTVGGVEIPTVC
jgi:regulator of sigma E protease